MVRSLLFLLAFSTAAVAQGPDRLAFRLKDTANAYHSLDDAKDAKAIVVAFLGTQCPVNNAYLPRLAELHGEYAGKGVVFLAINSNEHDDSEAIRTHAKTYKIPFPVLRDVGQQTADRFGAKRTPEYFVLDAQRNIRYQGRLDDRIGIGYLRPSATKPYLVNALDAVLEGKEVMHAKEPAVGCLITRAPRPQADASVTFAKDVSRIVQRKCQECHRPGQIAPMSLISYDDVSKWSAMIREVVQERRMPPWHADPKHGKFRNDRSLSKEEHDTLLAWIDQGCSPGDVKDMPAPATFSDGWSIGKPDVVFEMPREFRVPAKAGKGGVPYQHFVVPTNFEEDMWVQAAEARPGNRAVVHHILIYIIDKKRVRNAADGIGSGMLVAYAPGDFGAVYAAGSAKKVPKGSSLVFQMHYTPNGTEHVDRSSVGLVFAKKPPQHEIHTRAVTQRLFALAPGKDNQRVFSSSTFTQDALVWNLMPHMHLRGKSFEYQLVTGEKRETLLAVPRYDFGWQASYRLETPLLVKAGSRLECIAHFDNSEANLNNPDATKWVRWGDQTWEEMMIGFVDYTYVEAKK